MWLLQEVLMPSAKWHPALIRPWAEEVFRLAGQMSPGYDRLVTQKNAATAMSWINIERALEMLNECDRPTAGDTEDVRDVAARRIFLKYWQTAGDRGLPRIQRTATYLGETGQYPYGAMVPVIPAVSSHSRSKANTLAEEAVSFYGKDSHFQSTDREFIAFLKSTQSWISPQAQRQALESLVKNLTSAPEDENQHWRLRVYTDKGLAEFHSHNMGLLYGILPMIREVDPQWADRLVEQNPDLQQADAGRGKVLNQEGVVVQKNPDSTSSPADLAANEQWGFETGRLNRIQEIAGEHPDQALTMAMSIADPARHAMGLAYAAAGFGNHPDQASQMLKQSLQSLADMKTSSEKLQTYTAIAQSAASLHNVELLREAMDKGLSAGEQAYEEGRKEHPERRAYDWDGYEAMQKLTEIGTRADAKFVVGRLEDFRDTALQAYMLVSAARAVDEDSVGGWVKAFE